MPLDPHSAPSSANDFDVISFGLEDQSMRGSLETLRVAVRDLAWSGRNASDRHGHLPAATSDAMRDLNEQSKFVGAWGNDPVEGMHTAMGLLRLLADDALLTITTLLTARHPPIYGCQILTRTVLESCGRLAWLSTAGLSTRQRIARHENERLYSAAELARIEQPELRVDPRQITKDILSTADALGFRKAPAKKGAPPALEERRPSMTSLVGKTLEDPELGHVANYLSGVTHGTLYALLQALELEGLTIQANGPSLAPIVLSSDTYRTLLMLGGNAYLSAAGALLTYLGWADEHWNCSAKLLTTTILDVIGRTGSAAHRPNFIRPADDHSARAVNALSTCARS
jgi:hypothetical protein